MFKLSPLLEALKALIAPSRLSYVQQQNNVKLDYKRNFLTEQ